MLKSKPTHTLSLEHKLCQLIEQKGPLPLHDFLKYWLYDANEGYYQKNQHIIGAQGDFTTAPEISQFFGETLAFAYLEHWYKTACPKPIALIEYGSGRGTLMADMLRIFKKIPDFYTHLDLFIIEISPILKAMQCQTIHHPRLHHIASINDVPAHYTPYVVTNEYFDALPIVQTINGQIRCIDYDHQHNTFIFHPQDHGIIVETCPLMMMNGKEIAKKIHRTKGMGIFIDYGYQGASQGCTLQAVYNHQKVDLLTHVGCADISHQVAFDDLKNALHPLSVTIETQKDFLMGYGILERFQKIAHENPKEKTTLAYGVARLLSPTLMGNHFKVLTCVNLN